LDFLHATRSRACDLNHAAVVRLVFSKNCGSKAQLLRMRIFSQLQSKSICIFSLQSRDFDAKRLAAAQHINMLDALR
jgi:hypothetical protein